MHRRYLFPLTGLLLVLLAGLACSLGGPGEQAPPATAAAATVSALLTQNAATQVAVVPATLPPATQPAPGPTAEAATPVPSETKGPTSTPGVQGCLDESDFIADVTIPDNTVFSPGAAFTKTWRLKNSGTCNWVGAYAFAFIGGNAMGAPAAVPVVGNVAPGSLYEVSVDFTAPAAPGTYRSTWQLKNASGEPFGARPYVLIVVPAPTPTTAPATATQTAAVTPTVTTTSTSTGPVTVTLSADANSGGVYSPPGAVFSYPNIGDDESNASRQGFVTFNLAGIPASATITAVRLDLSPFDQLGSPFKLGCLRGYQQNFGTLDGSDFFSGTASGALWRFCSAAELTDPAQQASDPTGLTAVKNSLSAGQFQIRLQFNETTTNGNSTADMVRTTPKLIVTYTVP